MFSFKTHRRLSFIAEEAGMPGIRRSPPNRRWLGAVADLAQNASTDVATLIIVSKISQCLRTSLASTSGLKHEPHCLAHECLLTSG